MTLQERLKTYLELNTHKYAARYLYLWDQDLWKEVLEVTSFLPEDAVPKQRCWHVENDVWSIPTCPIDGVPVRWWDNHYNTYGSLSAKSRCAETARKCRATRRKTREAALKRPISERAVYRSEVMSYTKREWTRNKHRITNNSLRSRDHHLDHIYSIEDGFQNNIDPKIIGSWVNFRIIPAEQNYAKHMKSDISLDELLRRYSEISQT